MRKMAWGCLVVAWGWMATPDAGAEAVKNTRTSSTYATLTGAVAAALSGDTLLLTTGRFSEVVFIGAKNLTLSGLYNSTFTVRLPGGTTLIRPAILDGSVFTISNAAVALDSLDIAGGGPPLKVSRVYGGGICATHSSGVTASNCNVYGNSSSEMGGGLYASNSTLVLSGTSVYSNRANLNLAGSGQGGGVAVIRGVLQAQDATWVHHNTAEDSGGGVFLQYSQATLADTQVSFNTATNDGGGLALDDHVVATLSNCQLRGNVAASTFSFGGGIFAVNFSNLTSTATWIADNSAGEGGGVFLSGGLADGTGTFYSVTAENNQAREGGGGFFVDSAATLRLRSGLLIGNDGDSDGSDSGDGGAIYAGSQGSVVIEPEAADVLILENNAWNGGGIAIGDESSATLVCTQEFALTLSGNIARQGGGGIALPSAYGELYARGGIAIQGNSAEFGAGIYQVNSLVRLEGLATQPLVVSGNVSAGYYGGGILSQQDALLQLVNVQIGAPGAGNRVDGGAQSGAGIALLGQSFLQATNVAFHGNRCNRLGAGLFVSNSTATILGLPGDPAVDFSPPNRFIDNQATNAAQSSGGGIYVINGILTLHDALVASNSARHGGGLYLSSNSTNRVINCVIATNRAAFGGGARVESTAYSQFLHCTLTRNDDSGLHVSTAAPLFLTNCIVVANAGTNLTSGFTATHCLVEPLYGGVSNFVGDPLFMDPAALDFRLTYGSAATNRGVTLPRVARDAIGNARPASTAYDPGAFEYDWTVMDSDADAIPDDWEVERDLNPHSFDSHKDDDVDTWPNLDEYIADTDPKDDADFFRLDGIQTTGGQADVLATTSARRQYRMESLDDLPGAWQPVPGRESFGGAGGPDAIPDARPLQTNRNYRLQVWIP